MVGLLLIAGIADGVASASKAQQSIAAGWLAIGWIAIWIILNVIGYLRFGSTIGQHLAHLYFEMQEGYSRRWLWLRITLAWLSIVVAVFPINWLLVMLGRRPLHDRLSHCRLVHMENNPYKLP